MGGPALDLGFYNKLVKVAGSDRLYRDYPRDDFDHEASAETVVEPGLPVTSAQSLQPHFGAAAPYHPRGCIAQAWSVAEVLRCLRKTDAVK